MPDPNGLLRSAPPDRHAENSAITTLIEAAGTASVVGLLAGGAGLALVIVERSQRQAQTH